MCDILDDILPLIIDYAYDNDRSFYSRYIGMDEKDGAPLCEYYEICYKGELLTTMCDCLDNPYENARGIGKKYLRYALKSAILKNYSHLFK